MLSAYGKKAASFLVYTNIFISTCALALACETFVLLKLPSSINWYLLLLFLCTLFVYNLHYYVKTNKPKTDSRLEWCRKNKPLLLAAIILSALFIAGGVIFHFNAIFLKNGNINYSNVAWFIIIPLIALGYSHPLTPWNKKGLRHIGWLKMAALSFIWSFTTTVLPVLMLVPGHWDKNNTLQVIVLFIDRFCFMAPLSVLFNINDHEEDKADGVKTIAVILGPEKTLRYGKWFSLIMNILTSALLIYVFRLYHPAYYVAVLIPAVLVFLSFHRFIPAGEESFFVMRYDGLMIVKALLLIFALLTFSL